MLLTSGNLRGPLIVSGEKDSRSQVCQVGEIVFSWLATFVGYIWDVIGRSPIMTLSIRLGLSLYYIDIPFQNEFQNEPAPGHE
jgi:hypothetical protein